MKLAGWKRLVEGAPWFGTAERHPSPPIRNLCRRRCEVRKPYRGYEVNEPHEKDPWGWPVSEWEEARQLRPGLEHVAEIIVHGLVELRMAGRFTASRGPS